MQHKQWDTCCYTCYSYDNAEFSCRVHLRWSIVCFVLIPILPYLFFLYKFIKIIRYTTVAHLMKLFFYVFKLRWLISGPVTIYDKLCHFRLYSLFVYEYSIIPPQTRTNIRARLICLQLQATPKAKSFRIQIL